jgi:hypothetical protein
MAKKVSLLVAICSVMAVGCGGQDETTEIISNLVQAGYPQSDIMVVDGLVYVQNDAHVTLQASREMIDIRPGTTEEQYRTTNLVNGPLRICVTPTSTFNNYSALSAGLNLAIDNYNSQGLSLTFVRGPATCDFTISAKTTSGVGGSSGFPSGGRPYGTINIGTGLQSYSTDVNEHVITHEIGHTLGMRHSDYYNRAISCGSGGNEGSAGVGAIHIPGTPTTATVGGSIMNSCFRSTESGEFTSSDRVAFETLY